MNHLFRELAPVSETGWEAIDTEALRALHNFLAARKLVDVSGPYGWEHACATLGRVGDVIVGPRDGVEAATRRVQPLLELRTRFDVARRELDAIDRGSRSPDLAGVVAAARRIAEAEDHAIFNGYSPSAVEGVTEASPHEPIGIGDDYEDYPQPVAKAVAVLRRAGVDGPFGLALGPRCYTGVIETTRGGYPVLEHLKLILGGPVVWAPAVDGAVVVSLRGGDFELVVGQDLSIGYASHTPEAVTCFLEESLTFLVHGPEAAVALRYL